MLDPRSGALSGEHLAFIFDDALGLFRSVDEPALYGVKTDRGFVTSFDRAFNRWLPVPSAQISRDGSHYFYITAAHAVQQQPFPVDYVFHIVDVRTGGDRTITLRQQTFQDPGYAPIYYAREGIYVAEFGWEGRGPAGLWLLSLSTGKLEKVFDDEAVDVMGGGAAWLPHGNGDDPHAEISQYDGSITPNEVLRRDLNGGSTKRWLYRPGEFVTVLGLDSENHPIVGLDRAGQPNFSGKILLVTAPGAADPIGTFSPLLGISADAHGIWVGTNDGIELFRRGTGLAKISNVAGTPAGPCL
jgi:hypothetical protein